MKRKTLNAALLAGLAGSVGMVGLSNAVNVNPDGLGEVLIYPYYTVRGDHSTLISVVNTTDQVKAVKVRFLEGKASAEVLDFNLYLSPFDVWTGAILDDGVQGRLFTADISCTVPPIPADGVAFRNYAYVGDLVDDDSLDRTREGHIELIEMGNVTGALAGAATHPTSCGSLVAAWSPGGVWFIDPTDGLEAPTGGLFGGETIIQVLDGRAYSINAKALDSFSDTIIHFRPGSTNPSLAQVSPPTSIVFNFGSIVNSTWATIPIQAVSAVFMHNNIMNEYILDQITGSGTDWVVTFPTKRNHVDNFAGSFVAPFTTGYTPFGACERISLSIYDREENTVLGGVDFSPPPPQGFNSLCWETSLVTFDNSDVLASILAENVSAQGFENGWLNVGFLEPGQTMTSDDGDVYNGLPATGFSVHTFDNGVVDDALRSYGTLFEQKGTRSIIGI